MTKEQEDIKYLKESVCVYKNTIPKISEAIETVLNMLKEKDNIIEGKECVIETQARNEEVLLNTLKKKDKMIDLMAEELQKHIFVLYDGDTITSKKGIIQHYERKVEESSSINKTQEKN